MWSIWIWYWNFAQGSSFQVSMGFFPQLLPLNEEVSLSFTTCQMGWFKTEVHHPKRFCPSRAGMRGIITKMGLFQIQSRRMICHLPILPGPFAGFCLPKTKSNTLQQFSAFLTGAWQLAHATRGVSNKKGVDTVVFLDAWFGFGTRQHWWLDMENEKWMKCLMPYGAKIEHSHVKRSLHHGFIA